MHIGSFSIKGARKPAPGFADESDEEEEHPASGGSSTRALTASQLQEAGDRAAAQQQWSQAMRYWDAALAATPAPQEPHTLLEAKAQVFMEGLGQDFKAVQCCQRAVELAPGWAPGHLTLARAQLNLGEPELAVESFAAVLRLAPGNAEAAAEMAAAQAFVLQRRQSGATAEGQRAHVREAADSEMQID